jgi:hypothetical protein
MALSGSIIVCITDTHVGSTVGLAPPKFTIHTGRKNETQQVEYNQTQKWLHACWLDFWDYAFSLAGVRGKTRKHRLIILHAGDVIDSNHHNSPQLIQEEGDQIEAACNLLRPYTSKADATYLTYGTGAHNGGTAEHEISIGRELGIRHGWEFSLNCDGVTIDVAHHGRASRRDWTSAAAGVGAEVAADYMARGLPPPAYVIRGHCHILDDSGAKLPYTRAIMLPAWQTRTAFGYRVAANKKRSDIGGLIIDTTDPCNPNFSKARYKAPESENRHEVV